jgi:hypothetical protein
MEEAQHTEVEEKKEEKKVKKEAPKEKPETPNGWK